LLANKASGMKPAIFSPQSIAGLQKGSTHATLGTLGPWFMRWHESVEGPSDFRYWHKADILIALSDVRFQSGHVARSALPPIADIKWGLRDVCFVPILLQKSAVMDSW
jgi:hypothetical protein